MNGSSVGTSLQTPPHQHLPLFPPIGSVPGHPASATLSLYWGLDRVKGTRNCSAETKHRYVMCALQTATASEESVVVLPRREGIDEETGGE